MPVRPGQRPPGQDGFRVRDGGWSLVDLLRLTCLVQQRRRWKVDDEDLAGEHDAVRALEARVDDVGLEVVRGGEVFGVVG